MKGVFLIDPQWYMSRQMVDSTQIKFVFRGASSEYRNKAINWRSQMGMAGAHTVASRRIVGYRDIPDELVNIPFKECFWQLKRPEELYFDPETLSDPDSVMLPSGNLFEYISWKHWIPWTKQFPLDMTKSNKEQYRIQFNAYSVILAERLRDLDIIEEFGDKFDVDALKRHGLNKVTKMPKDLSAFAQLFGSSDPKDILAGTRMLVQRNAERLETAIEQEQDSGEYSRDVTNLASQVFNQGVTLAKMMDPSLRAGPKVAVQLNAPGGSSLTIDGGSANNSSLDMAKALKELLDTGVPLKEITDEIMIEYMSAKATGDPKAVLAAMPANSSDNTVDADTDMPF